MINHKLLAVFFAVPFLIFPDSVKAEQLIYGNDFENYEIGTQPNDWTVSRNMQWVDSTKPCMNSLQPATWQIYDFQGSKRIGMIIDGPGCITDIVPNDVHVYDMSNYRYEFDISLPISVQKDRNVVFKYVEGNSEIYGFTIKNEHIIPFYKLYHGSIYDSHLGSAYYESGFQANQTYRIKIEVINDEISLFINNEKIYNKQDTEPIIKSGTIALQASTGALNPSVVYFDNITVTDLSPLPTPTPTPTPYPYFSQQDESWKNSKYDRINRTIGQVGCALTSSAMVLKYYGFDKVPQGDQLVELNPLNLNSWLNTIPSGWGMGGSLNPSSITKLTKALNASDSAKYGKLEIEITNNPSAAYIKPILEQKNPLILKHPAEFSPSKSHFIVSYEELATDSGNLYSINDPWDENTKLLSNPPTSIERSWYFRPTNSDFSYIYLYTDPDLFGMIFNPHKLLAGYKFSNYPVNTIPNSQSYLDKSVANIEDQSDDYANPNLLTHIQYPISGKYQLIFKTKHTGWHDFQIIALDKNSDDYTLKDKIYIDKRFPQAYTLEYNQEGSPVAVIKKNSSFTSLAELIVSAYDQGWIKKRVTRDQLLLHVYLAERAHHDRVKISMLTTIGRLNDNFFKHGNIIEPAHTLIKNEITNLLIQ